MILAAGAIHLVKDVLLLIAVMKAGDEVLHMGVPERIARADAARQTGKPLNQDSKDWGHGE